MPDTRLSPSGPPTSLFLPVVDGAFQAPAPIAGGALVYYFANATTGDITITMPANPPIGAMVGAKHTGAGNNVNFATIGGVQIEAKSLDPFDAVVYVWNGTRWWVFSFYLA